MITCFICKTEKHDVRRLFLHFKTEHGLQGRYGTYCCGQSQCARSFHDKYILSQHLQSAHASDIEKCPNVTFQPSANVQNLSSTQYDGEMDIEVEPEIPEVDVSESDVYSELERMAAEFVCKCKQASASLSVVNEMVQSCSLFIETVVESLQQKVMSFLVKRSIDIKDSDADELLCDIESHKQPFKTVDTPYKQNKYWKEQGFLIEPVQYIIGSRQSYVLDKESGMNVPQVEPATGQYVPIKEMLQAYLRDERKAKLATSVICEESEVMRSYFDGNKWKQNSNANVLALRFYGDDFEPANPLGSHKTLYKVGCIYYQCEALPNCML